jgi:geranylgeranyl diphosphate synthase, type II
MTVSFRQFMFQQREPVEMALRQWLPRSGQLHAAQMNEALEYALFPCGKRWRPMLTLLGATLTGALARVAMLAGCAMEYLHTSSLILDDLLAMDDAPLRRGRPALHKVYGESVALLTALALLNQSYTLLARGASENGYCEAALRLVEEATHCIGADGMIGGQVVDLTLRGAGQTLDALASRNLKTTALMRLTMSADALACGADEEDAQALALFGEALGMAYQICDDLLDEVGESDRLGKPAKQDARHVRASHVAEWGVVGAHQYAVQLMDAGLNVLQRQFGMRPEVDWLAEAADIIVNRGHQWPAVSVGEPWQFAEAGSHSMLSPA